MSKNVTAPLAAVTGVLALVGAFVAVQAAQAGDDTEPTRQVQFVDPAAQTVEPSPTTTSAPSPTATVAPAPVASTTSAPVKSAPAPKVQQKVATVSEPTETSTPAKTSEPAPTTPETPATVVTPVPGQPLPPMPGN